MDPPVSMSCEGLRRGYEVLAPRVFLNKELGKSYLTFRSCNLRQIRTQLDCIPVL